MKYLPFILFGFFLFACTREKKQSPEDYPVRDYRTVKLYLDTINAKAQQQLDSSGTWTIAYTELSNGKKHLIFFGASHVRDVTHPQFDQMKTVFLALHPEIAFNEGGQISSSYPSADSAIRANGESGLIKYLSDSIGIPMVNGDMDEKEEFVALQKEIPKDQIYLYMGIERFLDGYRKGYFPGLTLEQAWQSKFIAYLSKAGFDLSPQEQSLESFRQIYKKYLHKNLSLDSLEEVFNYYLTDDGKLGDVGRATKIIRDRALLKKIDRALDEHDRVFVVFGGSHRIAVEPALRKMISRKR